MSRCDHLEKKQSSSSSTDTNEENVLTEPSHSSVMDDVREINTLAANQSKANFKPGRNHIWSFDIAPYLQPRDLSQLSYCSKAFYAIATSAHQWASRLSLHFPTNYQGLQAREVALKKPLPASVYREAYQRLRQTHYAIDNTLSDERNRQRQVFRYVMDNDVKKARSYELTLRDFYSTHDFESQTLITYVVMSKRQPLLDDLYRQVVLPCYQDAKDTKRMDVTKQGVDNSRLLYWAAICNQSPGHLVALIIQGALVNAATRDGETALYVAAQNGRLSVVKVLLNRGATVNQATQYGETPLYIAAQNGHLSVVLALLSRGAAVNQAWQNGATPLLIAAENGYRLVVLTLLNQGAAVNQATQYGKTPLYIAARNGHLPVVLALLSRGATVNQATQDGETPLYIAARNGHLPVVLALLSRGATANQARQDGATPLLIAAQNGHLSVVLALLSRGAAVNQARQDGATPLLIAAQARHKAIVCFLKIFNKVIVFCQARSFFPRTFRTINTHDLLCLYQQNSAAFLLACLHLFDAVNEPETYQDSRLKQLLTLFIESPTLKQMHAFAYLKNNLTHSTPSSASAGSAEEKKRERNANQLALYQQATPVFIRFLQQQNPEELTPIGRHMNSEVLKSNESSASYRSLEASF